MFEFILSLFYFENYFVILNTILELYLNWNGAKCQNYYFCFSVLMSVTSRVMVHIRAILNKEVSNFICLNYFLALKYYWDAYIYQRNYYYIKSSIPKNFSTINQFTFSNSREKQLIWTEIHSFLNFGQYSNNWLAC